MRRHQLLAVVALATALNLGLLCLYYSPTPKRLVQDENYYYELAQSIAAGHSSQHNLLWPPLYGELMGLLFSVFGPHRLSIQILQILLWLASALLFYRIVLRLLPSRLAANIALLLFLLSPDLTAFSHYLWPEMVHLFLLITGLWLLICHPESRPAIALAGVSFGLALLTKSLLVLFVPVILVFVAVSTPGELRKKLINGALMGSLVLLTILPTMVMNLQASGKFMIADSSVFNIWVGLNDTEPVDYRNDIAGREFEEFQLSADDIGTRNSIYREKILLKLQQQGAAGTVINQLSRQYFRLFDHETYFTTQLPGMPRNSYNFTRPRLAMLLHAYSNVLYAFILATSAIGMCLIRWRPIGWAHCLLLFIVYNVGLFLFLHAKTRYIVQFLPMMIFFSAVTAHWLARLIGKASSSPASLFVISVGRVALGVLLAILVEFLAFRSAIVARL